MAFALAERIEVESAVFAEHAACGIGDLARIVGQIVPQEVAHFHLAEETDALAVLFLRDRQVEPPSGLADLGFEHFAGGKPRVPRLPRGEQGQEIALIFVRIRAAEDHRRSVRRLAFARVVAGRHPLESLAERVVEKHAEFHLAIAPDVRVGRDSGAVALHQIVHDPRAVAVYQINHPELDPEGFAYRDGRLDVLLPRAIAGDALLVHPVFHVGGGYFVALFEQQRGRHRAVNPTGQSDHHLRHAPTVAGRGRPVKVWRWGHRPAALP